jgi:iron complex transport system ATP-binding protein
MTEKPLIKAKNLSLIRGGKKLLDNLNFEINSGENTLILGPNGAGKSLLGQILAVDQIPSYGSFLEILGKQIGQTNLWDLRKQIGFLSSRQLYGFEPKMPAWQIVASGVDNYFGKIEPEKLENARQKTRELLENFGISELFETAFEILSDGEKRKILLARSLINQPKILILDEPCQGLDIPCREKFLQELSHLATNQTLITITHHLEEIPLNTNKVIMIKNGEVFKQGDLDQILTNQNLSELFEIPLEIIKIGHKRFATYAGGN